MYPLSYNNSILFLILYKIPLYVYHYVIKLIHFNIIYDQNSSFIIIILSYIILFLVYMTTRGFINKSQIRKINKFCQLIYIYMNKYNKYF